MTTKESTYKLQQSRSNVNVRQPYTTGNVHDMTHVYT